MRQNLKQRLNVELNFKWFLLFLLVHQKFHQAEQEEELSTTVEDARLARAVGDTQNTPTTDKGDTHAVVGAGQDSTDNTHVGFRVLNAMDYCVARLMLCTLGNRTVRLIAATERKSTDETTAAGDLDGTYVLREARVGDNWKPGCTRAHHKAGNVEDPWREEDACLSRSQAPTLLEATTSLC
jgi:hypothetical protein